MQQSPQPKRIGKRVESIAYFVRQYLTNFGLGFGCFLHQRRNRLASERNVFLVRPSIGQALANDTVCGDFSAAVVVNAKGGAV